MTAIIRPGRPEDRSVTENILRACGNFRPEEIVVALEVWDDSIRRPGADYLLRCAEVTGRLAGYICYGPIPLTEGCWDLYWIAVDPAAGRQGIGSSLLRDMEADLRQRRARQIHVETSSLPSYDAARALYTRHGYAVTAVLPDFYRAGDDKLMLVKRLHPG